MAPRNRPMAEADRVSALTVVGDSSGFPHVRSVAGIAGGNHSHRKELLLYHGAPLVACCITWRSPVLQPS